MKPVYFLCGSVVALMILVLLYPGHTGNEIKIYSTGRNIGPVIEHLNFLIASESLTFQIVDVESEADISIKFQDDIGNSRAVGISYPFCGQIYIANSVPADQVYVVVIHELLHCAGVGHEPKDPSSVMYTHSQRQGQLKKWHAQYLHGLVGITPLGRIMAQARLLF